MTRSAFSRRSPEGRSSPSRCWSRLPRCSLSAGWAPASSTGGGERPPWTDLVLVGLEVGLARAADRAEPVVGDVLECGSRRYPAVGIALVRVVDEAARGADVELLC